jgi:membrane protein implicated in regulation of membrane protease activity
LTVFWRYWLLQIPGWVVLVALLIAANRYFGLPFPWAVLVFLLWFLKDWALYPMLKSHYRVRAEPPSERLVGRRATAKEALRPRGYVLLRGELWLAEVVSGEDPVAAGEQVTVEAVDGLILRVKPAPAAR